MKTLFFRPRFSAKTKKALWAALGIPLALVAAYAALGYWVAPGVLRERLVELAAGRHLSLTLDAVRVDPFSLRVRLEGVELRGPKGELFAAAGGANADVAWASIRERRWIVERLSLRTPQVEFDALPEQAPTAAPGKALQAILVRQASIEDGLLRFASAGQTVAAVQLELSGVGTGAGEGGRFRLSARAAGGQWRSHGGVESLVPGLALRDVVVEAEGLAHAGVALRSLKLQLPRISLPLQQPIEIVATAGLAPRGELSLQGSIGLKPLGADLRLEFDGLPITEAQRWLPAQTRAKIASGVLAGKGRLVAAGPADASASFSGSLVASDVRLDEAEGGQRLVGWQRAETASLKLRLWPTRVEIGELVVQAPQGRLVREADGGINFLQALGKSSPPADGGAPASEAKTGDGQAFAFSLQRLRLERGSFYFADRALESPFEATIEALSGEVVGIGTQSKEPARVQLAGRVADSGTVRIEGAINLGAPKSMADITAEFRKLLLPAFNPYVARFAGYRIASGRVSAKLHYRLDEGRLQGDNELLFERLQLGEKLQSRGLLDLPLDLAIALLADEQGRIDLRVPVTGDLNNPKVDVGDLLRRAIGVALRNIVTAPFRALARAFGGQIGNAPGDLAQSEAQRPDADDGRSLGEVAFEAGSVSLEAADEKRLTRIASALKARPRLGVTVQGGFAAAADVEAVRLEVARRDIAREAGLALGARPDLDDAKVLGAAERLYLERVSNRAALHDLRASTKRYGRALLEAIAAKVTADDSVPRALADLRATAVKSALLARGIGESRVRIDDSTERPLGPHGVPTVLALSVADSSERLSERRP